MCINSLRMDYESCPAQIDVAKELDKFLNHHQLIDDDRIIESIKRSFFIESFSATNGGGYYDEDTKKFCPATNEKEQKFQIKIDYWRFSGNIKMSFTKVFDYTSK